MQAPLSGSGAELSAVGVSRAGFAPQCAGVCSSRRLRDKPQTRRLGLWLLWDSEGSTSASRLWLSSWHGATRTRSSSVRFRLLNVFQRPAPKRGAALSPSRLPGSRDSLPARNPPRLPWIVTPTLACSAVPFPPVSSMRRLTLTRWRNRSFLEGPIGVDTRHSGDVCLR